MNEATRLFQKAAEAVAHDPVLARRVRRERMPLDHAWLKRYHALQRTARKTGAEFLGPEDPAAACEEFLRLTQEFQAGQWWGRFPNYEEALRAQFRPAGPPPEPCQGLPEEDWMAVQDHQFRLYKVGEWARTVDDANASDGKATAMPATHSTWAIQYPFSDDVTDGNPWRCYVEARCEAQADRGLAVTLGLYDTRTERTIAQRRVTIEECRGPTYRAFDLGAQDLHGGIYFWAAPAGNPEEVTGIYVDRLYLIREKPAPPVGNQ
jgi:hypothetical protein